MKALTLFDANTTEELKAKVHTLLQRAGIEESCAEIGTEYGKQLRSAGVVLYLAGSYYVQGEELLLSNFVHAGGTLIHVGGNPFSVAVGASREQHKGIRAFGFSDTFLVNKAPEKGILKLDYTAETENLMTIEKTQEAVSLQYVYEGLYMLSTQGKEQMERHADLTPIAGLYTEDGRRVATPIVRVSFRAGGRMYLLSATVQGGNLLEIDLMESILAQIINVTHAGQIVSSIRMTYPRYNPGEKPTVEIIRHYAAGKGDMRYEVLFRRPGENFNVFTTSLAMKHRNVYEAPLTGEGEYNVTVRAYVGNVCVDRQETAFFLLEEEQMRQEAAKAPRLYLNPEVSTDFLLQGGEVYPMHGTTYFVTDTYQKCFLEFNPLRCRRDLEILKADGFNTLRSGNWMLHTEFFGRDGGITEQARRSLQVYFYLAAHYGFQVQFTLGNIALNDWDKTKCAVHNPQNMAKVLRLMENFGKLFGAYSNVSLDILNEPSYSLNGAWTPIKPSGDPYERKAWIAWVKEKYETIEMAREAWGENAERIPSFDALYVPPMHCYEGNLYRTEEDREYAMAEDFWRFAQDSYNQWLSKVREAVKKNAPQMLIMMGRDETLRIPMEQDGVLSGQLDMVCWHQWNKETAIYVEYLLNRVKGHVSCAQELGVYRVERQRGGKRLTDERVAGKLERKLMFGFGNWIQWQSFHNPDKVEFCENMLGLYRSDYSETPAMPYVRALMKAESEAAPYLQKRKEDAFPILTLYSTSSHYSIYKEYAENALRTHIGLLNQVLRMQSDVVLEHLLEGDHPEMIGNPKLIFFPAAMRLSEAAYEKLMLLVKKGATLVVTGDIEEDELFARTNRISQMAQQAGYETSRKYVKAYETLRIGERDFLLDFRPGSGYGDVENYYTALKVKKPEKIAYDAEGMQLEQVAAVGEDVYEIMSYDIGAGHLVHCPLPLEIAGNRPALLALYRMAFEIAHVENEVYEILDGNEESVFVHAIAYESATAYTFVNEGNKARMTVVDGASGRRFTVCLPENRSAKAWISTSGDLISAYACDGVSVELI